MGMRERTETDTAKTSLADMAFGSVFFLGLLILPMMFGAWCTYRAVVSAPHLYIPYVYGPLVVSLVFSSIRPFGLLLLKPAVGITCLHGLAVLLGLL
jgi:hypothetical protein